MPSSITGEGLGFSRGWCIKGERNETRASSYPVRTARRLDIFSTNGHGRRGLVGLQEKCRHRTGSENAVVAGQGKVAICSDQVSQDILSAYPNRPKRGIRHD
ncbi:uncharacterized protein MCYG_01189 [Microsporum canis CBS 113480]|uniref:Uncharacterized protein n=1 Tax=Arthroderma otae (strain ATCC MYA-4605 / CBS 113480) TaxID=554155 RepID=C5FF07_ARTOC|nr:uncharacterized protein MCYG_01189 [Microsporum canis CBS 113480]EEQ28301.1 predicted protein [Microsporum canis CBS 113480]